jgi:hypoxanthine phosphoribosyltransferase
MKSSFSGAEKIEVLYSQAEIEKAIKLSAKKIADKYLPILSERVERGECFKLIFVAVLSGSIRYRTALVDQVGLIFKEAGYLGYLEEDEVSVSSYPQGDQPQEIRFLLDLKRPIEGAFVVLVEDIIDQGLTASWIKNILLAKKPASLELYALIDKTAGRQVEIQPDDACFHLEKDLFVVGFGLDISGRFRELPFIGYIP